MKQSDMAPMALTADAGATARRVRPAVMLAVNQLLSFEAPLSAGTVFYRAIYCVEFREKQRVAAIGHFLQMHKGAVLGIVAALAQQSFGVGYSLQIHFDT
ncbi:hypothetical protein [Roseovarius sp. Pro17]|uniref:hypothetical protein n=1 Tax=Roseovarius sp. Pro17 TaxID=3108175 RepID=UPI002D79DAEC|nr:hypothetical protein [Roseovarius sp. Pro17]